MSNSANTAEKAFVITRTLDAPLELVWRVYTEAEHLAHWFSPKGFTTEVKRNEVKPGGVFHYVQRNAQVEMWGKFVYLEVTAPEKLVYVNSFSDPEGNVVRAPFAATWPLEVHNTMTFTEENGKTTVHMVAFPHNATEDELATFAGAHSSLNGGYKGTFELLDAYLASLQKT